MRFRTRCRAAAAALLSTAAFASADPKLVTAPFAPAYGDAVRVELRDLGWPAFLPALRYAKSGTAITLDVEYTAGVFGPFPPSLGDPGVSLGELAPGTYWLHARLIDIAQASAAPRLLQATLVVAAPQSPGLYLVPRAPHAYESIEVVVRAANAIDPASVRHSLDGNVIRVEYEYLPATSGDPPAGAAAFVVVRLAGLAPGTYQVEGWGKLRGGTTSLRQLTQAFAVAAEARVVEFYAESLDHYFMTAGGPEAQQLDSGAQPGWKRTGQSWKAWVREGDAPHGSKPVCRFYASGPNSHFYTANPAECDMLKALEQKERSDAASARRSFAGWGYEGIAFWALVPVDGACPAGTDPVYRSYNGRAAQNDTNHRFVPELRMHRAMGGWLDEGIAFCSPR